MDPAKAIEQILAWSDLDPPEAIVLWNVIAEHKVLIAETAIDVPVFDVRPGEMYFESLERYFERPRPGLACTSAKQYGARLAGVVVKYAAEAARAHTLLDTPVHVIRNGIDLAPLRARAQANGRLTIGTLARLDPRKHVDRLLRALRHAAPRLPPHVLKIAGGPEPGANGYLDTLRGLAHGLAVEFVGEVEPREFLAGLDLFALVAEPAGCPNASLEAMARGLPVVATDAGGMREQIEDGVTGRLVAREDEEALARALVDLGSDREARHRLGSAGRERVRERFSMDAMADAYRALLPSQKRSRRA
jgi:glycosyltransferase involved in cell wall biosynthesis